MASRFLEGDIDIHGGGSDLEFPHHEAEIAQSELANGKQPFVRCWFHIAMVRHKGDKMSKSVGNLIMVRDLLDKYSPNALRIYLARHHYHESWSHDPEALSRSEELAGKLQATSGDSEQKYLLDSQDLQQYKKEFVDAMDDDLDTPRALEILSYLARTVKKSRLLGEMASVLGLRTGRDPDPEVIDGWERHRSGFR
jgi:cysteinyl-tRNA synthetase